MQLAKVIGTVVATRKDPSLAGMRILVIQPLTHRLKASGGPIAAIDTVQTGPGELVYWITAREASLALPKPFSPVDAAIVGIVDDVHHEDRGVREKEEIFE